MVQAQTNPTPTDPPLRIGDARQLFIDDHVVETMSGVTRVVNQPEKHPANPVVQLDRPWEGHFQVGGYGAVIYDDSDNLVKMWYAACPRPDPTVTCYATSRDGIRWDKPNLDVKPGTNISHPGNRDSCTIWMDLDEKDPKRRYKMFRFQKAPKRGLVLHYSEDGIHWSDEIAWAGQCHDRTTVFYNPFRKVWVTSIKATLPPKLYLYTRKHWDSVRNPTKAIST